MSTMDCKEDNVITYIIHNLEVRRKKKLPMYLVLTLVPQNSVVVGPQYGDFFKTKCVYADAGIDIFCKTDTGIDPVSVSFSVGGKSLVRDQH
ncbi:hypothetical protein MAR_020137 [Mya arenaria]|uniref:Uncharacterized protein n=1 Tax=Mya arenaria TaxID=6604 RepID=A0ABY7E431_MYAAR|nr:hypothetical protein MAR_020137 [Mya arenaria]